MIVASPDQLPYLPLLIADVSLEHSHRRTAVDPDAGSSAVDEADVRRPRRNRRLVGFLAATALAFGVLAAGVSGAPAAPAKTVPDIGYRLGLGMAQPPGYVR